MLIFVPLPQIADNPYQRRTEYGEIAELADSIRRHKAARPDTLGLLQLPVGRLIFRNAAEPDGRIIPADQAAKFVVNGRLPDDPALSVQLQFAHRRKRAFVHLSADDPDYGYMPILIANLTDDQMLDGVWTENRDRHNLSAVEEAELLQLKLRQLGAAASQRDVSETWGLARSTVANRLRLLKLPAAIQEANRRGDLSERQCLALAQITELDDLVGSDGKWGKDVGNNQWDKPASPAAYINHVLAHPQTTSEDIREMSKRMLRHAGEPLPEAIANHDFAPGFMDTSIPGLQQYACKGCLFRVNNTCLSPECLVIKEQAFGSGVARAIADELGVPFSDDPAHFALERPEREKLHAYYNSGGRQDVVVGWMGPGEYAVRPFHGSSYLHREDAFKQGGKLGIALGHRNGNLPAVGQAEVEDVADKATTAAWKKRAKKRATAVQRRAKEAVAARLVGADLRLLAAFVAKEDKALGDDDGELEKMVVDYLWDNGRWHGYSGGDNVPGEIEQIAAVLDKAGIGRAVLVEADKFTDLAERTVMWLDFWYHHREYSWMKNRWKEAKAAIGDLRREFDALGLGATGGELLQLGLELDRAWADIERKVAEKS